MQIPHLRAMSEETGARVDNQDLAGEAIDATLQPLVLTVSSLRLRLPARSRGVFRAQADRSPDSTAERFAKIVREPC